MPRFGFDENDQGYGDFLKSWKAKEGKSYQISLLWWEGLEEKDLNLDSQTPYFHGSARVWVDDVGYVLAPNSEYEAITGNKPKNGIVTLIVEWPRNIKGQISMSRILEGEYKVLPWVFTRQKYSALKERHMEFHLGQHDVKVKCEDERYQKLDISVSKTNILRTLKESDKPEVQEVYNSIIETGARLVEEGLEVFLGQNLSIPALKEKLGMGVASEERVSSDLEVDDILEGFE